MVITSEQPRYLPDGDLNEILRGFEASSETHGALVLLPEAEAGRLTAIQQAFRRAGCRLAGAIFPALVEGTAFRDRGCWVMPFAELPPVGLLDALPADPVMAAARIAAVVEPQLTREAMTLFLIFDAMVPNIGSILDALYLSLSDRVAYAGVNAGSETFRPLPCLFDDRSVAAGGVLCLLLPGRQGAALDHGYLAPAAMITATATDGNRIMAIDWRPAFEVYRDQVRALYGVDLTADNFYRYATHFPFGMLLANREVIVRIPVALESDGSLFCIGEVPANAILTLLRAPELGAVRSVGRIAQRLGQNFGGAAGRDLLTFYCAGRRAHLGAEAVEELGELVRETGARRLVGALSLGEIGSVSAWGYPLFHNATLVCRPLDS